VVGGGVASQPHLFEPMRRHLVRLNNGYIAHLARNETVSTYVVPPGLGGRAGVLGALELARLAYEAEA
jgi:fructokinase